MDDLNRALRQPRFLHQVALSETFMQIVDSVRRAFSAASLLAP